MSLPARLRRPQPAAVVLSKEHRRLRQCSGLVFQASRSLSPFFHSTLNTQLLRPSPEHPGTRLPSPEPLVQVTRHANPGRPQDPRRFRVVDEGEVCTIPRSCLDPACKGRIDPPPFERYSLTIHAIEFTTELSDSRMLPIPQEVAEQLPKTGRARIIVLTEELTGDADWRLGAYQQFLRDDSSEDAIYDSCR